MSYDDLVSQLLYDKRLNYYNFKYVPLFSCSELYWVSCDGKACKTKISSVMQLLQNQPLFGGTSFMLLISLERQTHFCAKARLCKTIAKMFVKRYIFCERQKISSNYASVAVVQAFFQSPKFFLLAYKQMFGKHSFTIQHRDFNTQGV